jgi:predicted 3-demethylubiquinone-9 3-methyltransferase (glyoxalase superfamily)
MATIQKIEICLWFDTQAEEAAKFYTSVFKNSKIIAMSHYGEEGHDIHKKSAGTVLTVEFEIEGQKFTTLNGGPDFKFNDAVSLIVNCNTQEEIDYYWDKLTPGGDPAAQVCGWLKDKYGVSWQVVPVALTEMTRDPHTEKTERVMKAMLKMKKLDMNELERAYHGNETVLA